MHYVYISCIILFGPLQEIGIYQHKLQKLNLCVWQGCFVQFGPQNLHTTLLKDPEMI